MTSHIQSHHLQLELMMVHTGVFTNDMLGVSCVLYIDYFYAMVIL